MIGSVECNEKELTRKLQKWGKISFGNGNYTVKQIAIYLDCLLHLTSSFIRYRQLVKWFRTVWNISGIRRCYITLEGIRISLALNFCSLTDCQKLWYNCSLFVNTSFDPNYVTSRLMTSSPFFDWNNICLIYQWEENSSTDLTITSYHRTQKYCTVTEVGQMLIISSSTKMASFFHFENH